MCHIIVELFNMALLGKMPVADVLRSLNVHRDVRVLFASCQCDTNTLNKMIAKLNIMSAATDEVMEDVSQQ